MVYCKDCKFHKEDFMRYGDGSFTSYYAHHCSYLVGSPHPVTGGEVDSPVDCSAMRLGPCGMNGTYFAPTHE